ncbi:MAG: MaoC family dehydratase [Motiliproteus sp.]|nr:MaoC family dehydratase [Motiliproteus sp.]MCW9053551.1 MaoC family dehydratase [Motiliproteus sp.]
MNKLSLERIKLGDSAEIEKEMTLESVKLFSELSEDRNPVHLDASYAKTSRYKKQIIHGMMASSLFSGLFGMKIPGEGCVYKSQNIRFKRPIYIGDTVLARIEVTDINIDKKVVRFKTRCFVKNKVMIDGESEIFIP